MDFACLLRKTPFGAAYTGGSEDIMYTYLVRRQCGQIKKHYEKGEVSPMNNLKEQKLNNKGFSLVELIIVIAIMAVLIGVLAPQYLKYVEKSRVSADADQIDTLISAVEIYSADIGMVEGEIVIGTDGSITPSDTGNPSIKDALDDADLDCTKITVSSKTFKGGCKIKFSATDGVTVTDETDTNKPIAKALGRASA